MKFRYFKGDKSHPVIAEICANAEKLRIQREEKLNNVCSMYRFKTVGQVVAIGAAVSYAELTMKLFSKINWIKVITLNVMMMNII